MVHDLRALPEGTRKGADAGPKEGMRRLRTAVLRINIYIYIYICFTPRGERIGDSGS